MTDNLAGTGFSPTSVADVVVDVSSDSDVQMIVRLGRILITLTSVRV
jgi:hypothetical protein